MAEVVAEGRADDRRRRPVLAVGFAVVAVGGAVVCEPGSVGSAAVALTTDKTVTQELNRQKDGVRWLRCTASYGDDASASSRSASASEKTVATVDCDGETENGKEITVTGKITHAVNGACVRGDITAKVDGEQVFRVDGLVIATPPARRRWASPRTAARGPPSPSRSRRPCGAPTVPLLPPCRGQVIQTSVHADRACIG
ncbi:hypothetical protein SHIRM173S_09625 [Streptomyces hirsutus]